MTRALANHSNVRFRAASSRQPLRTIDAEFDEVEPYGMPPVRPKQPHIVAAPHQSIRIVEETTIRRTTDVIDKTPNAQPYHDGEPGFSKALRACAAFLLLAIALFAFAMAGAATFIDAGSIAVIVWLAVGALAGVIGGNLADAWAS